MSNLVYGQTATYKFEMEKEKLDWLSSKVNRSKGQLNFLFQLVEGDFDKLMLLETNIKNNFISYCPNTVEEVNKLLSLQPKSNWFKL